MIQRIPFALVVISVFSLYGCEAHQPTDDGVTTTDDGAHECYANSDCSSDELCGSDYFAECRLPSEGGNCLPRATGCAATSPVCGCDGAIYASICDAHAAGTEASYDACSPPPGTFKCGTTFCTPGERYCAVSFESGESCEPLPSECADCDCVLAALDPAADPEAPGCSCLATADGLVVTCEYGGP